MFGERLRELRTGHGYTMDALAELYNQKYKGKLNKSTISRYENGLQEPMLFVVNNLAELFAVSVDYLTGKEEPTPVSEDGPSEKERLVYERLSRLSPENLDIALAQLDVLLNHQEKQGTE